MLKIPKGVTSVTSARKFAGEYPKIIKDIEAMPYGSRVAIGIEQEDEVKLVAITPNRYEKLLKLAYEAEENRILGLVEEAEADYEAGRLEDVNDEWFRKEYKRLGMDWKPDDN